MSRKFEVQNLASVGEIAACVISLFALEMLQPARVLYLCAPIVRNTPLLPNNMKQFSALWPERGAQPMRLYEVLLRLQERGATVRVISLSSSETGNEGSEVWEKIERRWTRPLPYRGIYTGGYCLVGTILFTETGVALGDESVEMKTGAEAHLHFLEIEQYWGDLA